MGGSEGQGWHPGGWDSEAGTQPEVVTVWIPGGGQLDIQGDGRVRGGGMDLDTPREEAPQDPPLWGPSLPTPGRGRTSEPREAASGPHLPWRIPR